MKFTEVTSPQWADQDQTKISCFVQFTHLAAPIPFTASNTDPEAHGREIFSLCNSGEYGPVAAYQAPASIAETLVAAVTRRRAGFNRLREATFAEGVLFSGKMIDTDPVSVQKINGAVTMALIAMTSAQPFSIDWTCADDTSITLDASGMIGLGVTVGLYADSLHQRTRTAKAELDAAATVAEVNAVVW